jgi:hypothetical protein
MESDSMAKQRSEKDTKEARIEEARIPLSDSELEKATGGKIMQADLQISKHADKTSVILR